MRPVGWPSTRRCRHALTFSLAGRRLRRLARLGVSSRKLGNDALDWAANVASARIYDLLTIYLLDCQRCHYNCNQKRCPSLLVS